MKPFLKYALLTSAVIIIWSLIIYLTGLDRSAAGKYLNYASYPIMILFIVLAVNEEKSLNGGYLGFDPAFKTGFFMMLVVAAIMGAFTYVYFSYINPGIMDLASEKARESMEDRDMSKEEIERAMRYAKFFMSSGAMTAMAFFLNIILGAVFSLIIAAIMKKEKPLA